jgi:DNA-binding XRE family transcriptional regulator
LTNKTINKKVVEMKELYKKFKELTGFNYQDMADKVGVTKQHIHKCLDNQSMIYRTSVAAVMNFCIDDKIEELEKHITELKGLKKEVMHEALQFKEEV